jgi:hypothetical protein
MELLPTTQLYNESMSMPLKFDIITISLLPINNIYIQESMRKGNFWPFIFGETKDKLN